MHSFSDSERSVEHKLFQNTQNMLRGKKF